MEEEKKKSNLILYAEDDPEDRMFFNDALLELKANHKVKFVEDGAELINYLHHEGDFGDKSTNPEPELIILDLNMPKMDGCETLERIRNEDKYALTPVVIFSTSRAKEDITKCYKLGANTFICKPDSFSDLVKILDNVIEYWFENGELPAVE
ncbi:MAG: response regulator [Flammeovirgaceae bacterium]|nr:response regulator [Flammeovirgaceae bacterium]